jgi:anti-sigma factor RsiW
MNSKNSSGNQSNNHPEQDDDRALVSFLQQYKSAPPAPMRDLEQELMQKILAEPVTQTRMQKVRGRRNAFPYKKLLWAVPAAIAALGAGIWFGSRPTEPQLSQADRDTIEASLVKSWSASADRDEEDVTTAYLLFDASNDGFTSYQ